MRNHFGESDLETDGTVKSKLTSLTDEWTLGCLCRKNDAAQKQYQPYVPKKLHELNLNIGITHDDSSPGAEGQYNGCAPFNGFSNSLGTSAHLLSGKTIANSQHIPINSNVTIDLLPDSSLNWPLTHFGPLGSLSSCAVLTFLFTALSVPFVSGDCWPWL